MLCRDLATIVAEPRTGRVCALSPTGLPCFCRNLATSLLRFATMTRFLIRGFSERNLSDGNDDGSTFSRGGRRNARRFSLLLARRPALPRLWTVRRRRRASALHRDLRDLRRLHADQADHRGRAVAAVRRRGRRRHRAVADRHRTAAAARGAARLAGRRAPAHPRHRALLAGGGDPRVRYRDRRHRLGRMGDQSRLHAQHRRLCAGGGPDLADLSTMAMPRTAARFRVDGARSVEERRAPAERPDGVPNLL